MNYIHLTTQEIRNQIKRFQILWLLLQKEKRIILNISVINNQRIKLIYL